MSTSDHPSVTINPPDVPPPQPQFSQINTFPLTGPATIVAITGQLDIGPDGTGPTHPGDFAAQVDAALAHLATCLAAAGATKRDVFKVTHYVVDFDFEKQNPAQSFCAWLEGPHRPASVMMPVQRLAGPGFLYEIECWAIVPGEGKAK